MKKLTQTSYYDYVPIVDRKPMELPGGARIAVIPYVNVEHFPEHLRGTALVPGTANLVPDVLNYGWRDYGNRVGLWRIMEIMDAHCMRGTVCLNADAIIEYPRIIEEGEKRKWAWMGHGMNNSPASFLSNIDEEQERKLVGEVLSTMEKALGRKTKGWIGPFLSETPNTPNILADMGVEYLCDFTCDDQPFKFNTRTGSLIGMPYSLELNDVPAFLDLGQSASTFGDMIVDQFDVLYAEGETNPRFMPIVVHSFLAGQPFRAKHLKRAFDYIAGHDKIWFTTGDEINAWYRKEYLGSNGGAR